jgi:hypothetical protein
MPSSGSSRPASRPPRGWTQRRSEPSTASTVRSPRWRRRASATAPTRLLANEMFDATITNQEANANREADYGYDELAARRAEAGAAGKALRESRTPAALSAAQAALEALQAAIDAVIEKYVSIATSRTRPMRTRSKLRPNLPSRSRSNDRTADQPPQPP